MRKGRRRVIQAVLFDFDGVLTIEKTGSAAITEYIAKRCGLPAEQVRSCYRRYNQALLLGEMTHAEIWPAFCEALGQKLDYQLRRILSGSPSRTRICSACSDSSGQNTGSPW